MPYIKGVDRNQTTLFPESIEDYITSDSQVRVIDAYIEQLDYDWPENKRRDGKIQARQMIVEHPFWTIKRWWGGDYFLTRGIEKV